MRGLLVVMFFAASAPVLADLSVSEHPAQSTGRVEPPAQTASLLTGAGPLAWRPGAVRMGGRTGLWSVKPLACWYDDGLAPESDAPSVDLVAACPLTAEPIPFGRDRRTDNALVPPPVFDEDSPGTAEAVALVRVSRGDWNGPIIRTRPTVHAPTPAEPKLAPAPGAALLGVVGLAVVGRLRRRLAA